MSSQPDKPATLINILKTEPARQEELIALLNQNIENVIHHLDGWLQTRLIAGRDSKSVVIFSQWRSPADVEAMRDDPRMQAYFPKISALASFESIFGDIIRADGASPE